MADHIMGRAAIIKDDPKRPWKAYGATAVAFVGTFVAFWIGDDDPFTKKEAAQAILSAALSSGLTGGTTFFVSNPKKVVDL